jgi:3-hydroxybutyryl-CoA dehydrogenase
LSEQESARIQSSIVYSADISCFRDADLVIEAIPEVLDIKTAFFRDISPLLKTRAIVATNTSAISINDLSGHIANPERFCGTHYLNPPHIIPLVEITPSEKTAQWAIDALYSLFVKMEKQPVVLKKDIKGFLSNRLQFALLREASYLVESGVATPEDIDRTLRYGNGIRYAISGPFKIVDLGGIGVFNKVAKYLYPVLSKETEGCALLEQFAQKGCDGVSTGGGFYPYTQESALQEEKERDCKMLKINRLVNAK